MSYYTRAQIGDAAVPDAHLITAPVMYDVPGDDLPSPEMEIPAPMGARPWRARQWAGLPPGPDEMGDSTAAVHAGRGSPDIRRQPTARQPAGYPEPADEALRPWKEEISSTRTPPDVTHVAAPVVPKAGSTGADTARQALIPRWLFNRAFGNWTADIPPIIKIPRLSPLASTPYAQVEPTINGLPNPGGNGITVTGSTVGADPNTVRPIPRRWDEGLLVQPDPETRPSRRWGL